MSKKYKDLTFSDTLELIPQTLQWAEKQDVSGLRRFLLTNPELPLYCVSSGGSSSALTFASLLYASFKGMARMVTPLTFASISLDTLRNSKVLIFSKSGHGCDVDYLIKRISLLDPERVGVITHFSNSGSNALYKEFSKRSNNWFMYNWRDHEGFIVTLSPFAVFGLLYKAYTDDVHFASKLGHLLPYAASAVAEPDESDPELIPAIHQNEYTYTRLRGEGGVVPMNKLNNYLVLYGGWGEPVAQDFESKMVESGIATVQLCDFRNFCHGRFIFLSKHIDDSVIVALMTPRERKYFNDLFVNGTTKRGADFIFPDKINVIQLTSNYENPFASIELLYKETCLFNEIGKAVGTEPTDPENPGGIQKRGPRTFAFEGLENQSGLKLRDDLECLSPSSTPELPVIVYQPDKSLEKNAQNNKVSVETIQQYIEAQHIDRSHDEQAVVYNAVWRKYLGDSSRSVSEIAKLAKCTEDEVRRYLSIDFTDIPCDESRTPLVSVYREYDSIQKDIQALQTAFERVKEIQTKHPEYETEEVAKRVHLKLAKDIELIASMMQMEEFTYGFKDKKVVC